MRFHLSIKDRDGLPPCQSITIGRLDFRRYTTVPSAREGLPDQVYVGAVGEYTEEDLKAFREKVQHFAVRWGFAEKNGEMRLWSASVRDTRVPGYSPGKDDEPLAGYLTVTPITVGAPEPAVIGSVSPEQLEAVAAARASEDRARQDPADAATRRAHGRAKARGEGVEG